MKKLMILGGPEFQIPLIRQAKEMGLYTYVLDMNPQARGAAYADEFIQCSLKDREKVLAIAKEIMPDGVTVGMCDVAVNSAALVCRELNLPGLDVETALRATDKYLMIQEFEKYNVPHPWYRKLSAEDIPALSYDFSFPFISKPVDMAGSRGINKIECRNDAERLMYESLAAGGVNEIIIEEFLDGPEVSVEMLVKDFKPHVIQITDKYTSGAPHFVELGHSQPSLLPEETRRAVAEVAEKAALALHLNNCCAHAEIIITAQGPKMVEIGARMGGDSIQEQLILYSAGINMSYYSIRFALGEPIDLPDTKQNMCSAIRFLKSDRSGVVKAIRNLEEAGKVNGVRQMEVSCQVGDEVAPPVDSSGRLGFVISQAESVEEAVAACERSIETLEIIVE